MRITSLPGVLICTFGLLLTAACADAPEENVDLADAEVETVATEDPASAAAPADGELINPNNASREQLLTIAALDTAAVDAILADRPYMDMIGLDAALTDYLSEEEREALYRELWIPIDLNAASAEEILLIPGVGPQMQHEFEEYRPYTAIEQFRREIGKYVDEEEVARLEQYVRVPNP